MESRFRLSSISENEELVRLRNDILESKPPMSLFSLHAAAEQQVHSLPMPVVEEEGPEIRIVTGACKIGKVPQSCEDAYFIHERGFGVADGVSGWNDYGFSSSLFSTQLMEYSKDEVEKVLESGSKQISQKKRFTKMKKSSSQMSMENLLLDDEPTDGNNDGSQGSEGDQ